MYVVLSCVVEAVAKPASAHFKQSYNVSSELVLPRSNARTASQSARYLVLVRIQCMLKSIKNGLSNSQYVSSVDSLAAPVANTVE